MTPRPARAARAATGSLLLVLVAGCASGTGAPATTAAPAAAASAVAPSSAVPPSTAVPPASVSPAAATPAPDATRRLAVAWAGGRATGDTGKVAVAVGTPVEITVTSDRADELHLHGYDLSAALTAGGSATLRFTASLAGVFELELHGADRELLRLQVG
ncbi:hypothetical protein [Pseudonocardia sp. D17]|uniref:hypothetical protein n=1 Tax=Pseudonocardia sp. D17 TaxID=882661 RepID=UPI0030D2F40B|nr:hypothetical protein PSD17_40420 [Pseudonocardia sp. D17]